MKNLPEKPKSTSTGALSHSLLPLRVANGTEDVHRSTPKLVVRIGPLHLYCLQSVAQESSDGATSRTVEPFYKNELYVGRVVWRFSQKWPDRLGLQSWSQPAKRCGPLHHGTGPYYMRPRTSRRRRRSEVAHDVVFGKRALSMMLSTAVPSTPATPGIKIVHIYQRASFFR